MLLLSFFFLSTLLDKEGMFIIGEDDQISFLACYNIKNSLRDLC